MEDLLAVYARSVDPRRPLICFDEGGNQLQSHSIPPIPMQPGRTTREDYLYGRHGTANLFMACAPYLGWRQVWTSEQRTAIDVAHAIRRLIDEWFPTAERIVLVTDNLNTHHPAAFYHAFPPTEARRLVAKLEWHDTPKHGSWLNMAELELAVLARQCLDRRIPDRETLEREVSAWCHARNLAGTTITWSYSLTEARRTLPHLYPIPEPANHD